MTEQPERDRAEAEEETPPLGYAQPAPIGPGDMPNVAGSNERQAQLSGEPEPGIQPDET
jgi:hypothetical protein